ncbi:MAG: transporter [Flammeovirgaceae bacterium]
MGLFNNSNFQLMTIMRISFFLFTILLSTPTLIHAQHTVSTDRPSVGFNSYIVPKGTLTGELGYFYSFDESQDTSPNTTTTLHFSSLPNTMFRYGISKRFEVRAGMDYLMTNTVRPNDPNFRNHGLSTLNVGFKTLLVEKGDPALRVSLLNITGLPFTANEDFRPDHPTVFGLLIVEKFFSANSSIHYNIGGTFAENHWTWNSNLGYNYTINSSLSAFAEVFSFYLHEVDAFQWGVDGGLAYVFARKYQLDIAAGIGMNDAATDFLLNIGFSFLIDRKGS